MTFGRLKPKPMVALLTIVLIVGTLGIGSLGGCGRYGRPKRPSPEPAVRAEVTAPGLPSSLAGL
jgi:hypothetical protein